MKQYLTPMGPTPLHVNPIFEISPLEPRFSEWLVFEGLSIDETGKQHFLDATVAYKRAVLNCIHYLSKFGYTKQQVLARCELLCDVPGLRSCQCPLGSQAVLACYIGCVYEKITTMFHVLALSKTAGAQQHLSLILLGMQA